MGETHSFPLNVIKKKKKSLADIFSPIFISKSEYQTIREIDNYKYQQILIGFLAIQKLTKNNYITRKYWKYIKKIISRYIKNKDILQCIDFCYHSKNILDIKDNNSFSLLFLDNSDDRAFEIYTVDDLLKLGEIYEKFCGGKTGYCIICNEEFIKKSNFQKYCYTHSEKKKLEKHKRYNEKRRKQ